MKKATQYWITGCGCGCAMVILGFASLTGGIAYMAKSTLDPFEEAVDARTVLEEQHGAVTDFTPWGDGAIPAARMEAFLTIRDATQTAREDVVTAFAGIPASKEQAQELEDKPFFEKMKAVSSLVRSSAGIGTKMGAVFAARNQALLDANMGLGEYTYIFVLAFYVDLGHSIDDHGDGIPMPNIASDRLPKEMRKLLQNQLASLDEDQGDWKMRLTKEVEILDSKSRRLPWEEGLPDAIALSLAPYRERLEASYVPEANPFELGRNERHGSFSIQAE